MYLDKVYTDMYIIFPTKTQNHKRIGSVRVFLVLAILVLSSLRLQTYIHIMTIHNTDSTYMY
jgi:hypothetical protein